MEDAELDAIRQRRMAQMMGAQGGKGPVTPEQQQEQEEARRAAEENRRSMLHSVMSPDARERLARIALVKPDKARSVENMILGAAQSGRLSERVSEDQLKGMLEQLAERDPPKASKVTIQRRRPVFEDDL